MAAFSVGITGGLASGKSTLASWFAGAGCAVLDADEVVANLYAPGAPGTAEVERLFGPGFLTTEGAVDRAKLAGRVFGDQQALATLESAVHPLVRDRVRAWLDRQSGLAVVEATLMLESGLAAELDLVIAVSAAETLRSAWAMSRGMTPHQIEARLAAQSDDAFREAGADVVIRNNGSLEDFRRKADDLIETLLENTAGSEDEE